jgi:hypothetical protein
MFVAFIFGGGAAEGEELVAKEADKYLAASKASSKARAVCSKGAAYAHLN